MLVKEAWKRKAAEMMRMGFGRRPIASTTSAIQGVTPSMVLRGGMIREESRCASFVPKKPETVREKCERDLECQRDLEGSQCGGRKGDTKVTAEKPEINRHPVCRISNDYFLITF